MPNCPICDVRYDLDVIHHCSDEFIKRREAGLKGAENKEPRQPTFSERLEIAELMHGPTSI